FLTALGAKVVNFPEMAACCGSYQILANESAAFEACAKILKSASDNGAEAMVLSCPVCEYNLGHKQEGIRAKHEGIQSIPTFYFTQLLAVALGLEGKDLGLKYNEKACLELLKTKKYMS
ncbi:MAG: heterodisulfide reductase-related iron-sulfur binding cluster, partial [Pseudomonadota bacterium]